MSVDLAQMTAHLAPAQQDEIRRAYRRKAQNPTTAFLLCFFLGLVGAHRMYLRQWGGALMRLLLAILIAGQVLAVAFGTFSVRSGVILILIAVIFLLVDLIWEIVDLFRIDGEIHRHNLTLAETLIGTVAIADTAVVAQAMTQLDTLVRQDAAAAQRAARTEQDATEQVADRASMPSSAATSAGGSTTGDDAALRRSVAEDASGAAMSSYASTTETMISGTPNASAEAPTAWTTSERNATQHIEEAGERDQASDAGIVPTLAADVLGTERFATGIAAAEGLASTEQVTRSGSATSYSHTESVEVDQTVAQAAVLEQQATWSEDVEVVPAPPYAPVLVSSGEPTDFTDSHPHIHHVKPVADIESGIADTVYVTLPSGDEVFAIVERDDSVASAPALADAGVAALGWGIAGEPQVISGESVEQPPAAAFVPPVVPLDIAPEALVLPTPPAEVLTAASEPTAMVIETATHESRSATGDTLVELAGFAATAGAAGVVAGEFASSSVVPAEPPQSQVDSSSPAESAEGAVRMKRVRVIRKIVVEGQVVDEQVVEELVPVDADTASTAQALQVSLGHKTPEQIAQMAHLSEGTVDVRQRTELQSATDGSTEG